MDKPIEVATDHRCMLADLTRQLGDAAAEGTRGSSLAEHAQEALRGLDRTRFERCCAPAYLRLAPREFHKEIQIPIASHDVARLDTRVLLWPVGAEDGQHPHCEGWASFMTTQGTLAETEERDHQRQPEHQLPRWSPAIIYPSDDISHHIHNRGTNVGLTIHIFGV